jgi:hypothetical protein
VARAQTRWPRGNHHTQPCLPLFSHGYGGPEDESCGATAGGSLSTSRAREIVAQQWGVASSDPSPILSFQVAETAPLHATGYGGLGLSQLGMVQLGKVF